MSAPLYGTWTVESHEITGWYTQESPITRVVSSIELRGKIVAYVTQGDRVLALVLHEETLHEVPLGDLRQVDGARRA